MAAGFGQHFPGFAIVLIFVAIFPEGGDGVDGDGGFERGEKEDGGGNEVPGLDRDDVGGEEVDFVDGVRFFDAIAATELAEVSGAVADGGGFDLDAKEVAAEVDGDVVFEGIAPGLEDAVSMKGGGGHELKLDPFAALFVGFEFLPVLQCLRPCGGG